MSAKKPPLVGAELARRLREYAAAYETAEFFQRDPSRFMREAKAAGASAASCEATAFVASSLSFGSIDQFLPRIRSIVDAARGDVDRWIRDGAFEDFAHSGDRRCFYRYVTWDALNAFLRAYRRVMNAHGTLGEFVRANSDGECFGAVKAICAAFAGSGAGLLVPANATSACKRLCMFMRWMGRAGSPVDLGLWADFLDRRTLIVPLDVHVMHEARALGLATSANATMPAALKLTALMSEVFPDDPAKGDFALFGHSRETSEQSRRPTPPCAHPSPR